MSPPRQDPPLASWQRQHIVAAVALLRERFGSPPDDPKVRLIHDRLIEVLDPLRRQIRLHIEGHGPVLIERRRQDRRAVVDRRIQDIGPLLGPDRRSGRDRRSGGDRRA